MPAEPSNPPPDGETASIPVDDSRRRSPNPSTDNGERDGIEMHQIHTREDDDLDLSSASISSGEYRVVTQTRSRTSRLSAESKKEMTGVWGSIYRFWTGHVVLTVPQKSNRDHFALERTFLAYIRTSVMIAMQGVLIAQLFRLQRLPPEKSTSKLGFYEVGIPLSVSCHSVAVLVAILGAYRFWKQQNAVSKGRVYAGGWELNFIGVLVALIILATFVLSAAITAELESD